MAEISKPKVDIASLPEMLIEGFRCIECKKYLRPPILIICDRGHKVCDLCKACETCKACGISSKVKFGPIAEMNIRDVALENMIKDLHLPISCKYHGGKCDFSGDLASVIEHEKECPFRPATCDWCKETFTFNLIEDHMAKKHEETLNGEWDIAPCKSFTIAMKSWRYRGIRIFATLTDGRPYWHLCVTAACGRNEASKLRAEIRLSSNLMPDCNDVFYRPVLHFESTDKWGMLDPGSNEYTSCLHIPCTVVWKHIKEDTPQNSRLQEGTTIPLTINIFEKVFLTVDKADIDEKDESDQDGK